MIRILNSFLLTLLASSATIILGMDTFLDISMQSRIHSIDAIVGSKQWPLISNYGVFAYKQFLKVQTCGKLFMSYRTSGGKVLSSNGFKQLRVDKGLMPVLMIRTRILDGSPCVF